MRHACLGPKSCNSTGMNARGMIHLEALGSSPGLLDQEVFVTTICPCTSKVQGVALRSLYITSLPQKYSFIPCQDPNQNIDSSYPDPHHVKAYLCLCSALTGLHRQQWTF